MRQMRFAIAAGIGVLVLCGMAVASAVMDYTSHPTVANAHVPPVVGTPVPASNAGGQAPVAAAPVVIAPVQSPTADPLPSAPPPRPVAAPGRPGTGTGRSLTPDEIARLMQQLQQRRRRFPRPRGPGQ
jgi:hypothetical protein